MSRLKSILYVSLIELACRAWEFGDWCEDRAAAVTGKVVRLPAQRVEAASVQAEPAQIIPLFPAELRHAAVRQPKDAG